MKNKFVKSGFAASLVGASALPAFGDDSNQLQEIVVTAQKRSESIQGIALAVSALTGDQLAKMGAVRFEDFALSAPSGSFIALGPVQDKVVMRGLSSGTTFDAPTPSTGYYIDDVPVSSSFTSSGT